MKALWPKSLFGQLMALVAIALFLAQTLNFAMLVRVNNQLRFVEAAGPVIARVMAAADRVEAGDPIGIMYQPHQALSPL